jgi:hypothetical protein
VGRSSAHEKGPNKFGPFESPSVEGRAEARSLEREES